MRKVVASLVVLGFAATSAFGGTVDFTPDTVYVMPGEAAVFDVGVATVDYAGGNYGAVNFLFGSMDGLPMSFAYDAAFEDSCSLPPPEPMAFGVYPSDLFVGGNQFNNEWTAPMLVGELSVDTTGLAVNTSYDIVIDAPYELSVAGTELSVLLLPDFTTEALVGMGTIKIVPEPAALVLLGIGGLVALRRRRA